jgi:hypothetical protein
MVSIQANGAISWRWVGRSLALLTFCWLPLFIGLRYLLLGAIEGSAILDNAGRGVLFQYLLLLPQFVVGGALYLLLMTLYASGRSTSQFRGVAVAGIVIVPLTMLAFARGQVGLLAAPDVWGPLGIALLGYSLLLPPPPPR